MGFKTFLFEREIFEKIETETLEQRQIETSMLKTQIEKAKEKVKKIGEGGGGLEPSELADEEDLTTLSIGHPLKKENPEKIFQRLCVEMMKEFQDISSEVRQIITRLAAVVVEPSTGLTPSHRHFASLLAQLQQLERLKFELTVHQQMLHNQHYVTMHPRAHGQLSEHSHHVHSVTDAHGRVREHPSHCKRKGQHAHGGGGGELNSIHEDEADDGDGDGAGSIDDGQELSDNAQPFTRHLSALLSDTAFQSDAPYFLFPPSGAAPTQVLPPLPTHADGESTLHAHLSEDAITKFENEVAELKSQENEVVSKINEIIEEIRMEVMDQEAGEEDEEGDESA